MLIVNFGAFGTHEESVRLRQHFERNCVLVIIHENILMIKFVLFITFSYFFSYKSCTDVLVKSRVLLERLDYIVQIFTPLH